jgi:hypothetical protein
MKCGRAPKHEATRPAAEGEVSVDDLTFDATEAIARFDRAGLLAAESWRPAGGGFVWVVNVTCPQSSFRAKAATREDVWRRAVATAERAGWIDRKPKAD